MSCARHLVKTPYSLHFPTTTRRIICRMFALLLALPCWVILLWGFPTAHSMRLSRPWTEKHWCESVVEPEWPFAYEKFPGNEFERKGRTNSNRCVMQFLNFINDFTHLFMHTYTEFAFPGRTCDTSATLMEWRVNAIFARM